MTAHRASLIGIGVLLMTATGISQARLPELAAKIRQPFSRPRVRELIPKSLDELAREADLVVQGVVNPTTTHLSPKGTEIYTDYIVTLKRVLFSASGMPQHRATPGFVSVQFTQYGGTMVFDGVRVDCFDEHLPLLEAGFEAVLFLKRHAGADVYDLVGEIGAFGVRDGRLEGLVKPASVFKSMEGTSVSELATQIAASRRP